MLVCRCSYSIAFSICFCVFFSFFFNFFLFFLFSPLALYIDIYFGFFFSDSTKTPIGTHSQNFTAFNSWSQWWDWKKKNAGKIMRKCSSLWVTHTHTVPHRTQLLMLFSLFLWFLFCFESFLPAKFPYHIGQRAVRILYYDNDGGRGSFICLNKKINSIYTYISISYIYEANEGRRRRRRGEEENTEAACVCSAALPPLQQQQRTSILVWVYIECTPIAAPTHNRFQFDSIRFLLGLSGTRWKRDYRWHSDKAPNNALVNWRWNAPTKKKPTTRTLARTETNEQI